MEYIKISKMNVRLSDDKCRLKYRGHTCFYFVLIVYLSFEIVVIVLGAIQTL